MALTAVDAKQETQMSIENKAKKLSKKASKFIGKHINPAIVDAIEDGGYSASVKIPKGYNFAFMEAVAKTLANSGYDVSITTKGQRVRSMDINWDGAATGRRGTVNRLSQTGKEKCY